MATASRRVTPVHPLWYIFWAAFLATSVYFLLDSVGDVLSPDLQDGSTTWNRIVWYVGHAVIASPILLIAPLQFMPGLRQSRPQVHRWLGRVFLGGCIIAGLLGVYLGSTLYLPGSRVPLTLLASTWIFFAAVACRRPAGVTLSTTANSPSAPSRSAQRSSGYALSTRCRTTFLLSCRLRTCRRRPRNG